MLEPLSFEGLNEADIREEVIAPLLRRLGYRSGSRNDVIREQSLRYPRLSLGRKDRQRDPELRGKADYILEVEKRLRWVIEAKPPKVGIGGDDIEQAWTYANHPEVRAIYFAICNGRTLVVYRTVEGPEVPPVLSLKYENFERNFQRLENLLGPEALSRDFPHETLDVGIPLARGLRSMARITNGMVRFEKNNLGLRLLSELQMSVREGAVERDEENRMIAFLSTVGPSRSLQELNERLGLSKFEMISTDSQLSVNKERPTVFVYENRVILPAGERLLDLQSWKEIELPMNLTCDISASASGVFDDAVFSGIFTTSMKYLGGLAIDMSGSFEMYLA
jgi:hypothetical protein